MTALVTGASGGIGLETARALAAAGHHVVLLARDRGRGEAAQREIGGSTSLVLADLGILSDVRRAAAEVEQQVDRLDVLVDNAGITIRRREVTPDGLDRMLAVNHLGPFLLTNLLRPLLVRSAPSRVVVVASDAHKIGRLRLDDLQAERGYGLLGFPRYGETKLMNILFTRELARRLAGSGVTANAVHPGAVATSLGAPPGPIAWLTRRFLLTPEQGARTSVLVAGEPSLDGVTGGYFVDGKRADRKLTKQARDDGLAAELWEASERLVGERFP